MYVTRCSCIPVAATWYCVHPVTCHQSHPLLICAACHWPINSAHKLWQDTQAFRANERVNPHPCRAVAHGLCHSMELYSLISDCDTQCGDVGGTFYEHIGLCECHGLQVRCVLLSRCCLPAVSATVCRPCHSNVGKSRREEFVKKNGVQRPDSNINRGLGCRREMLSVDVLIFYAFPSPTRYTGIALCCTLCVNVAR